jgi:hypothetical protein
MKYSLTHHYKYKLEETEMRWTAFEGYEFNNRYMKMLPNGQLFVQAGYAWDGSSIPHKGLFRFLSLGIYKPDKYCKVASLIHDALCQAMREGLLPASCKQEADALYRDMCIGGGMSHKQANRRYRALRKFGDVGIKPEKNPRNKIYDTSRKD